MNYNYEKDGFLISTNKKKLQIKIIHEFLTNSYWGKERKIEVVEKSIENSLCYGIYFKAEQVGFARVITDYATFAYLADLFILDKYRGKGLSKWLMEIILSHPDLQTVNWILKTRDAHSLYSQYGFIVPEKPDHIMEKKQQS